MNSLAKVNAWIHSKPQPIPNDILYRDIALSKEFSRRQQSPILTDTALQLRNMQQVRPLQETRLLMPDDDIAILGKHRDYGVCWHCGNFFEISILASTHISGLDNSDIVGTASRKSKDDNASLLKSAWRAQKQIRRICNTAHCRYLWTLTLAPPSKENDILYRTIPLSIQHDYHEVRRLWKQFLRRWKRELHRAFRWVLVLEEHNSVYSAETKRHTWHIHFATPDRLEWVDVMHFWSHGHCRFDDFERPKKGVRSGKVRNPGAYISKYIGKSFDIENLYRKRYSCSRDIPRPQKLSIDDWLTNHFSVSDTIVYQTLHSFKGDNGHEYSNIRITYQKHPPI